MSPRCFTESRRTRCRQRRTSQKRWRCQTPRGHQTCTSAVSGRSYSRLCSDLRRDPRSGSVGKREGNSRLTLLARVTPPARPRLSWTQSREEEGFRGTHRHSKQVVSLEVLLGSDDVLGQVQTFLREVYAGLQLLFPPSLVGEATIPQQLRVNISDKTEGGADKH